MKRYQIILLVIVGVIVLLWVIGRLTGGLQFYKIPTASMEPSLKVSQRIFTTNFKKPKRNDIIVFSRMANEFGEPDPNGKRNIFCSRLIGIGGDTLQIINGYAYINGLLVDDTTKLKFAYIFPANYLIQLKELLKVNIEEQIYTDNSFNINHIECMAKFSYEEYKKAKTVTELKRMINTDTHFPDIAYPDKNWSLDNFGPYIIPPDYYFVLGDNRHGAQDSRFVGPIPAKDFKGVLIGKF